MLGNEPLVSIGVPVFNGERFIAHALNSLLAQNYKNCEIIVCDNDSSDSTRQICQEFAARDSRIKLHFNDHNIGALENFSKVLELAEGQYFMWAAVDDYWTPDFVEAMVSELELHPSAGVSFCAVERNLEDGTLYDRIRFDGRDNPNHKGYYRMGVGLLSPRKYNLYIYGLFRTVLLRRAMATTPLVSDWDRWIMLHYALAARFRYVGRVLYTRIIIRKTTAQVSKLFKVEEKGPGLKFLFTLSHSLFRSPIIPLHRKFLHVPLLMFRYACRQLWSGFQGLFYKAYKEQCPPSIQKKIQAIKSRVLLL